MLDFRTAGSVHRGQLPDASTADPVHRGQMLDSRTAGSVHRGQLHDVSAAGAVHRGQMLDSRTAGSAHRGQLPDVSTAGPVHRGQMLDFRTAGSVPRGQLLDASTADPVHRGQMLDSSTAGSVHRGQLPDVSTAGPVHRGQMLYFRTAGSVHRGQLPDVSTAGPVHRGQMLYSRTAGSVHRGQLPDVSTAGSVHRGQMLDSRTAGSVYRGQLPDASTADPVHRGQMLYFRTAGSAHRGQLPDVSTAGPVHRGQMLDSRSVALSLCCSVHRGQMRDVGTADCVHRGQSLDGTAPAPLMHVTPAAGPQYTLRFVPHAHKVRAVERQRQYKKGLRRELERAAAAEGSGDDAGSAHCGNMYPATAGPPLCARGLPRCHEVLWLRDVVAWAALMHAINGNGTRPAPNADVLRYAGRRVLLVGEGNFAYAAELARDLQGAGDLTASGREERRMAVALPGAAPALATLARTRATTLHGVDATALRRTLAGHAERPFDVIRWNHPHSDWFGTDAAAFHTRALRAFLRSACEVLRAGAEVHIVSTRPPDWMPQAEGQLRRTGATQVPFATRAYQPQRTCGGPLPSCRARVPMYIYSYMTSREGRAEEDDWSPPYGMSWAMFSKARAVLPWPQQECTMLGVPPGASIDAIRKAYRTKARRMHPDKAGPQGTEAFKALAHAYEALQQLHAREATARTDIKGTVEVVVENLGTIVKQHNERVREFLERSVRLVHVRRHADHMNYLHHTTFQIFVRGLQGQTDTLDVAPGDTVADVLGRYAAKTGARVDGCHLKLLGCVLDEEATMMQSGVHREARLEVSMRVRGGTSGAGGPPLPEAPRPPPPAAGPPARRAGDPTERGAPPPATGARTRTAEPRSDGSEKRARTLTGEPVAGTPEGSPPAETPAASAAEVPPAAGTPEGPPPAGTPAGTPPATGGGDAPWTPVGAPPVAPGRVQGGEDAPGHAQAAMEVDGDDDGDGEAAAAAGCGGSDAGIYAAAAPEDVAMAVDVDDGPAAGDAVPPSPAELILCMPIGEWMSCEQCPAVGNKPPSWEGAIECQRPRVQPYLQVHVVGDPVDGRTLPAGLETPAAGGECQAPTHAMLASFHETRGVPLDAQ
eukprot:gene16651-22547_t